MSQTDPERTLRPQELRAFLRHRDGAETVCIVGVTGHLSLDDGERQRADRALRVHCDTLFTRPFERLRVLSGLAPGADLVATEVLIEEAARRGIAVELIALLPGEVAQLVDDWVQRLQSLGAAPSAPSRQLVRDKIDGLLRSATHAVDLSQVVPATQDRQRAYRRLAALLAGVPDLLFAVCREGHEGQEGGALEVVRWRRDPRGIPPELLDFAGSCSGKDTVLIDPRPSADQRVADLADLVRRIRARLKAGNALSAYDLANAALESGVDALEVRYLVLLSLAATGSAHAALEQFESLAPAEADRNEDWLSLRARLYKDLAFAAGGEGGSLRKAADEYEIAHQRTGGMFSGINAATLRLLVGDEARARVLAKGLLQLEHRGKGEMATYYHHVSRAEAALILRDVEACRRELALANALVPDDLITRSRTRGQLRRIADYHRLSPDLVDVLEMPGVHVLQPDRSRALVIDDALAARLRGSPLFAVIDQQAGSLQAVEACLQAGARVNLVLADATERLLEHWGERHGEAALRRLRAAMDAAERVSSVLGFLPEEGSWAQAHAGRLALGLARIAAANLKVPLEELSEDGRTVPVPASADALPAAPSGRRMVGLIFTDAVGFRRYTDEDLRRFWTEVMPDLAAVLAEHGDAALLKATWGDAIHVVTDNATVAAELCLQLIARVAHLRSQGSGAIARLNVRIGAHFAPAFEGFDPVMEQRTYYGTQLAFAASVEPITPPGMAYVTEAFAAQLELEAPARFQLEYAGELALAKRYGSFRLHGLMQAAGR